MGKKENQRKGIKKRRREEKQESSVHCVSETKSVVTTEMVSMAKGPELNGPPH